MSTVEGEDALLLATAKPPKVRRRWLRSILLALMAQYTIIAMVVGLSVAGILRYVVTPQIVAKFEAIEAALKRLPAPQRARSDAARSRATTRPGSRPSHFALSHDIDGP